MCTSPIIIKNKRKRFIPYVDKPYIQVPCGKCLECRNARRNEIYVLSYYEHLQAISNGGCTQFFTLTYDDAHMPKFAGRNCFSRENVSKFLAAVTSQCRRTFGNDFRFRYIVCSETDSKGVRDIHPHHHFLFFVQQKCNMTLFRNILKSKWNYGWSFGSWDNNGEVNRPNGIRYVTKYVCKDAFDQERDRKWLNAHNDVEHGVPLSQYYKCKRTLNVFSHSKNYGYFAIQHIMEGSSKLPKEFQTPFDTIVKTGRIFVPCSKDGVPGTISLPRSLARQLFFFVTWRYKRITPRDVALHRLHGTPVPKHKVQSFYIPKADYYDFNLNRIARQISKANESAKAVSGDSNNITPLVALGISSFPIHLTNSNLSYADYFDKVTRINMERDPIFERDPFDGSFSYKRAPLERVDYPELARFCDANYNSYDFLRKMESDTKYMVLRSLKSSQDLTNEKTYKDVSHVIKHNL